MKATSANEFETALKSWTDRVNNYLYADVHGNFGYTLAGRIPIRGSENGWGPVAGWTGMHDWKGCIPSAELPRVRNPETGWVVSCNQRVADEHYPYYLTNFGATHYRVERIASRIDGLRKAQRETRSGSTVEDMTAIHADAISLPAQSMRKALERMSDLPEAAEVLLRWDCAVTADSAAAALYEVTTENLSREFITAHYAPLADELLSAGDAGADEHWRRHLKAAVVTAMEQSDESLLPAGESWNSLLSKSLKAAVAELEARLGPDRSKWRWGDLHRSGQRHPLAAVFPQAAALLNPPSIELAGDADTPLLTGARVGADYFVSYGSVNRYAFDPANWSNGRWIVPLGASGHPGSAHYADQQDLWAKVDTVPQLWDWDEIGRNAQSEQELTP